jgi:hypothetical protein
MKGDAINAGRFLRIKMLFGRAAFVGGASPAASHVAKSAVLVIVVMRDRFDANHR